MRTAPTFANRRRDTQLRVDDAEPGDGPIPRLVLPASLDAPALARLHLRQALPRLPPAILDDTLILTSELVTNAVLHGRPEISVSVELAEPELTVVVTDGSPVLPA